jgi:uncharacterized protein (DUF1330 family)
VIYYTQLIFIREGGEEAFQRFEAAVLPLLDRHNGRLLYRVRPNPADVIETAVGLPYEVHLVSFESRSDFESYANDPERQQYLSLKNESVENAMLIEGVSSDMRLPWEKETIHLLKAKRPPYTGCGV